MLQVEEDSEESDALRADGPAHPAIPEVLATLDADLFLDAFPFHVEFDRETVVRSVGSGLEAVLMSTVVGRRVVESFQLKRPSVRFTWDNVCTGLSTWKHQ